ncbi:unnamed protein product, partial [Brenthis ino]
MLSGYPGSEWYFDLLIKAKLGYGLFVNGELVAWVFIKEIGALGHLYTLEDHRRKGYGELVLKLISNWLLEKNKYVFAFCVDGNKVELNLNCLGGVVASMYGCTPGGPGFESRVGPSLVIESFCISKPQ